jgi:glycine dehydrogenase
MTKLNFQNRHIGPGQQDIEKMLDTLKVASIDELIEKTIPASIRINRELNISEGLSEQEYLEHIRKIGLKNKQFRTYTGMGYYNTFLPPVIQRNILENPGWYTSYTPYQAEISQGRLEALLNYQTMVTDLTGLPLANASLLDEATAAAEAMIMVFNSRSRAQLKEGVQKFFVADHLFPQTEDVLKTRARPLGIEIEIGDYREFKPDGSYFGAIIQYPDQYGEIHDMRGFTADVHEAGAAVIVAADIMSLALLTPPGEWGADIVVGSTQRFGIPLGYGGPHAAYFAALEKYKRAMPGRIIGISKDSSGNQAFRMALQTREQHIKRERATSNICTAQALLATMAGMYAAYHGPEGIKQIAADIHAKATKLEAGLKKLGFIQHNRFFFDTLKIELTNGIKSEDVRKLALSKEINFRYVDDTTVGISLDETVTENDLGDILYIFGVLSKTGESIREVMDDAWMRLPEQLQRQSEYLTAPSFNLYHSETEMMRYMKKLENKDLALNRTMIPLGSCTMKLNAASQLFSLSWPEFANIHPFVPQDQAAGYLELIKELEKDLCEITGFSAVSFQPNSGASGEHTGLLVINEYHKSRGEGHRNICLIPSSAHGTNPASSIMAGLKVVVIKTDEEGNIDLEDLKQKAEEHSRNLAAIMVTYPSTHGVFEEGILEVAEIIHKHGGQVYMDGANMNAQVGYTNPAAIGADVCHLNLHKTFAIPHGGGGPGVGPIGVAEHLKPFLPGHTLIPTCGEKAVGAVSAAPFGSSLILPISYGYIKMLGKKGLKDSTAIAIINTNYIKKRLENHYKILYSGKNGYVAHEMIIDCNGFHRTADIMVIDIAKRLMDYGFHAPTVAFPVAGTLMVEPTESESLAELDRFCNAMLSIRKEIAAIEQGLADTSENLLKNAPHTADVLISDEWDRPYNRMEAGYPGNVIREDKYFPPVGRIDDAYGDRNLVCTCQPVEHYMETE